MPLRPLRRPLVLTAGPALALGLLAGVGLPFPSSAAVPAADRGASSVFVWYAPGATAAQRQVALQSADLHAASRAEVPRTESVPVPAGEDASDVAASLRGRPGVRFAIPDLPVLRDATPAPDQLSQEWGLRNDGQTILDPDVSAPQKGAFNVDVDAPEAWARTRGSRSTIVAVIDSGVDITHPDLAPSIWTNPRPTSLNPDRPKEKDLHGWDFCHEDGSVYDPDEYFDDGGERELNDLHGTHVAGTIAAADDGAGTSGVAPGVTIMPLKVFGTKANGDDCGSDGIFEALVYAALHGAKVVNASWSISATDARDRAEIDDLFTTLGQEYGIVIVAAAGNGVVSADGQDAGIDVDAALAAEAAGDTSTDVPYPAASLSPNVITVGAVDNRGRLAPFSNYGYRSVDLLAPGVSVWSTIPGALTKGDYSRAYGFLSGTSMAAPHVTGEVALLASAGRLPATELVDRVVHTGKPLRSVPARGTATNDMADAYRALQPGTTLESSVAPPTVHTGGRAVATATLHDAVTWTPLARQLVVPCFRAAASRRWSCAPAVRTGLDGRASVTVAPSATTAVRWYFRGVPGSPAAAGPVQVVGLTRRVSAALSSTRVASGGQVRVTGRVTPGERGTTVLLQHLQGGRWRDLLTGVTDGTGRYRFRVQLERDGTRALRVLVPASDGYSASTSSKRTLTVT
ncbi:subtilisin family serine protease [Motilibacter rhizosphaerae]|uniref:Subtilisin family serine protease n=1 Tax=Motilibacter rhizosphaerae TaxID=598652 RepID=A0A4Q7NRV7_9ACTN|nr:S8 family serine peptidase [Motilibacter rhizosphaerae]RZS89725.1 subtilisin family serine protease [Motilibacter rhizosphaerae]